MMQISSGLFSTGQPEDEERPAGLERGPSTHQLQGSLPTPQGSGGNHLHAKINLARLPVLFSVAVLLIRIRIKVTFRIRIRIKVKGMILIRIKVTSRIRICIKGTN
jgi:hypothetical protein